MTEAIPSVLTPAAERPAVLHGEDAGSLASALAVAPAAQSLVLVGDPQQLRLTLKLNGEIMQNEDTSDMIFTVARLIEYLSHSVELQPGDVICTGSPAGNGMHYNRFIRDGDVLEGSIAGTGVELGAQRNRCILERSP